MALRRGASARDYWLDLADEARANTQDALANGNHHMAGLWDEHERTLLRNAYEDVPSLDVGDSQTDNGPSTMGEFLAAANASAITNNDASNQPNESTPIARQFGGLWGSIGRSISEAANSNALPVGEKTYEDLVREGKLKITTPTDLPTDGLINPSKLNAAQMV